MKIAFIGLGKMGYPMAGHIQSSHACTFCRRSADKSKKPYKNTDFSKLPSSPKTALSVKTLNKCSCFKVAVYNRTVEKAQKWAKQNNATYSDNLQEIVKNKDIIFLCVGNDKDVLTIVENFKDNLNKNCTVIDCTTTSPTTAKKVAQILKQKNVNFLDAPVSGGETGAIKGVLTTMVGGNEEVFKKAKPILKCFSSAVTLLGDVGSGQTCKMFNQICIAGTIQGLAEGVKLSQKMGLDVKKALGVISKGAAGSWQVDNRGEVINKGEFTGFGFSVKHILKDLKIANAEATEKALTLDVLKKAIEKYENLVGEGSEDDYSSIVKSYK